MTGMPDVSAIIVFHAEGYLAPVSLKSFTQCCHSASETGLKVERIAVVDKPDPLTRKILDDHRRLFDKILFVDFGDLGKSRNAARSASSGSYVTFFDGDDLWGNQWIWRCHKFLTDPQNAQSICHPEYILYFTADDYLNQSTTVRPHHATRTYYMKHQDSADPQFDPETIVFNNLWTANSFSVRGTYERYPYIAVDRDKGLGVEDWTWNAETLAKGIRHAVVPDTVHCVRVKSSGSLGAQNAATGLLPAVHRFASELEKL